MSAKYGYTRRDSCDDREETESELHLRAPEYRGYSRQDLKRVVTLIHKSTDPEQQTIKYCIDNGYMEVDPDVWAGNWHAGHPEYQKMLEQIPESLRRFVNTQQQQRAKVQVANAANTNADSAGNGNGGDVVGASANNPGRSQNLSSAGVSARSETDTDLTISSDDVLGPKSEQMVNVCGTDEPMTIPEAMEDLRPVMESWGAGVDRVREVWEQVEHEVRKKRRVDYYKLFDLPTVCSEMEIKKQYKVKALELHPDKWMEAGEEERKEAEEKFKLLGEGLEILTDDFKRQLYDEGYDREAIEER